MTLPWYPRDMGKYARDTGTLSLAQHGAYCLLLDYYYSSGPINIFEHCSSIAQLMPDHSGVYRLCKATTKAEQDAVDFVLKKFFTLDDKGFYRNAKCDEVIEKQTEKHDNRVRVGRENRRKAMLKQCLSNAIQKETKKETKKEDAEERETIFTLGERIAEIVGGKDDPNWLGNYSRLGAWLAGGCDFELDILPTIKKVMAKKRGEKPKSLNYFESAIADAYATRTTPMEKGTPNETKPDQKTRNKSERARAAAMRGLKIDIG